MLLKETQMILPVHFVKNENHNQVKSANAMKGNVVKGHAVE